MMGRFLALLVLCLCAVAQLHAAPLQDGPYVTPASDGKWIARWVEGDDASPRVREETLAVGRDVTVAAVGTLPAFKVKLRSPASPVPDEVKLPPGVPLFVMADTHGEFEIAVELLTRQKVIDFRLRWSFGKGHLAVLGDIFDRGPHQTEILWLLYKLEAEAKRAGGAVHVMLGNHESMALGDDERYLAPKYLKVRETLKASNYAELWSERTLLGQWLRTKPAVMKIGDYLCLHGGLSRETVDRKLTLAELNGSVRSSLGERRPDGFVMGPNGPLWYRGYFPDAARQSGSQVATAEDVDAILGFYAAKAIFVGHTIVPTVTPLYGGRVIAVQVYPRRDEARARPEMEALRVSEGKFWRARIDGTLEPLTP
jgi:calcineurin-like phosphoesterase family protein